MAVTDDSLAGKRWEAHPRTGARTTIAARWHDGVREPGFLLFVVVFTSRAPPPRLVLARTTRNSLF